MKEFLTRVLLEVLFIIGSILALYCSYLLWAKRSYRKAQKPKEWKFFEDWYFLFRFKGCH